MAFKDLSEFADDPVLELPIDGRIYVVRGVDGETGLWATRVLELGQAAMAGKEVDGSLLDDDQERAAYARLLGDTFQELLDAGVTWERIKHCAYTALLWITSNMDTAEKFWETWGKRDAEGEAEALEPNRASRRAASAAASTTRKRASTSGTRVSKTSATRAPRSGTSSKPGRS
jgi:hypothetical protein